MGAAKSLEDRLAVVTGQLATLMRELPAERVPDLSSPGFVFVAPSVAWAQMSPAQRAVQTTVKRSYDVLSERLRLLAHGAPEDLVSQLADADQGMRIWIEFDSNWSLAVDSDHNVALMQTEAQKLVAILDVLSRINADQIIVVPDTNSLLQVPDPVAYRQAIGSDTFVFMLLPTVLGELDKLKVEHRNPEVREKARSFITRVKGWRGQGSLSAGVTVDRTITVQTQHAEPDMGRTLSWLDASVQDDRIIASVLALANERPGARILLVTSDINLLNKADAALIETAESS